MVKSQRCTASGNKLPNILGHVHSLEFVLLLFQQDFLLLPQKLLLLEQSVLLHTQNI